MALPTTQKVDTHQASTKGVPLLKKEYVLENIHPSWLYWWKELVVTVCLGVFGVTGVIKGDVGASLPFVGVAALIGGYVHLARRHSRYVVTTERVYKKVGLVKRTTSEARIADIHTLSTDETILERLIGEGTVQIDSTGAAGLLSLTGTDNHEHFANVIRKQQQLVE